MCRWMLLGERAGHTQKEGGQLWESMWRALEPHSLTAGGWEWEGVACRRLLSEDTCRDSGR